MAPYCSPQVPACMALVLTEWNGWLGSSPREAAGAGLSLRHLPFLLTPAQGPLAPEVAGTGQGLERIQGSCDRSHPTQGPEWPRPLQHARLALELLISLSGRRHSRPWGVIRACHVCRSATYRSPIRHSICSSLEGQINLDVADLEHQVTCSQL